ncbi:beta-galactosidase [Abditibacteriota bacterium]|nr:beta-galactosidase [Abditibacteriota bacterium]
MDIFKSVVWWRASATFSVFALTAIGSITARAQAPIPREQRFNTGWKFLRIDPNTANPTASYDAPTTNDTAWESVVLPHTPRIEEARVRFPFQGICWYRKSFAADPAWKGKSVVLEFGAAMQSADVWFNGQHLTRHLGGYQKFQLDLTRSLKFDGPNSLAVRLDNRDTEEFPPGKPTRDLDFIYPGGLYRGASLLVTDPVHISDPITANIEAGGGVFVTTDNISPTQATVHVKTHVANDTDNFVAGCQVMSALLAADGTTVAQSTSFPVMIAAGGGHPFVQDFVVNAPQLWHPDHPALYTVRTTVLRDGKPIDQLKTRFGIRHIELGKRFRINGAELHIIGSNRHQEYPYLGYALSPAMARRDAVKIKEAGLNFIRLSHYPQDPAFLDACDELGILVQAPIPGWQMFRANASFVAQANQDVRDLIRRDRNHPSIVFWEPNLNESSGQPESFMRANYEIAHDEYPGDQCFTFGDGYPKKHGWGWDVQGFAREYGDFGFGGNESTTRQTRANGEKGMLQQTWNFLWCLNDMGKAYDDPNATFLGAATWCMFDYNRGYDKNPCWAGMMDIYRLPKFTTNFFQSQRDSHFKMATIDSGPMVHIANFWTARQNPAKVIVFSNCQEVELQLNGRTIARQKPDSGPDTPYSGKQGVTYDTNGVDYNLTGGNPFDGGNAKHLAHPPFTFTNVTWQAGELKAIGYLDGKVAAQHLVRTPEAPASLQLEFDTAHNELVADGADAVFVRALVVDKNGTVVPDAVPEVKFTAEGAGHLVGNNPLPAEAGIGSILLQAGLEAGTITVRAESPGLRVAQATIRSVPGSPVKIPAMDLSFLPPPMKAVISTSREQKTDWRYITDKPADDWQTTGFDDSQWKVGPGGFGQSDDGIVGTRWTTPDIWLRHEFTVPPGGLKNPLLRLQQDDSAEAYINGVLVQNAPNYSTDYVEYKLSPQVIQTLKPGKNVLAIHCHQVQGPQFVDAGIFSDPDKAVANR